MTPCIGVAWLNKCTGMTPLVFFVMRRSASLRSISKVSGSMSTRMGLPPSRATQEVEAKKVKVGVSTSAPSLKPRMSAPSTRASDPEATPTAYFEPRKAAASFSNSATAPPRMKSPFSMTAWTAASNSDLCVAYSRVDV